MAYDKSLSAHLQAVVVGILCLIGAATLLADESPQYDDKTILINLSVELIMDGDGSADPTGIDCLDSLNQEFGVFQIEKLFPPPVDATLYQYYLDLQMDKIYVLKYSDSIDIELALELYDQCQYVVDVEPNYLGQLYVEPADPDFDLQWGLYCQNDYDIDAKEAWDYATSSSAVIIAVLDSGVDTINMELRANCWVNLAEKNGLYEFDDDGNGYIDDVIGWDAFDENPDCLPSWIEVINDTSKYMKVAHGTMVAGILAACEGNPLDGDYDYNICGVNWVAQIMNVKCSHDEGKTDIYGLERGIYYAACTGANILSISQGFPYVNVDFLERAVDFADSAGCVMIAAAKNSGGGRDPYPAAFDNVIMVGRYRTDGCTTNHSFLDTTAVIAPGYEILTTARELLIPGYGNYGSYHVVDSGTSFATPHVSGVAGLVMAKYYDLYYEYLSDEKVREVILNTAIDEICGSDPPGWDGEYGRGKVSAYNALVAVSRGDVNADSAVSISDAVYLINYVYSGGAEPTPYFYLGDTNCDSRVNISDAVYLINYIFSGGDKPKICYLNLPK